MILARFYEKPGKGSIHMTLRGHAGAGDKGQDLICASASMLAYTAGQAVQFLYEQGMLKCKPRIRIREGSAEIIATPKFEALAETLHTFWVIQTGIYVLAHNYPQNVAVETVLHGGN